MSKTNERVDVFRCDAPGCDVRHFAARGDDKPDGLFGTVVLAINGYVGPSLPWYACRTEHVQAAIERVLDDAQEAERQ